MATITLNVLNTLPAAEPVPEPAPAPKADAVADLVAESEYVAVSDDDPNAGVLTFWNVSGRINIDQMRAAWEAAGLDGDLLRGGMTSKGALRNALNCLTGKRVLRRPLKGLGYALVSEEATDERVDHEQSISAVIDGTGALVISPYDHPLANRIRSEYDAALGYWLASDFTWEMSNKLIPKLNGTALRKNGGGYFIPREKVAEWRLMCEVIQANSEIVVYNIPMLRCSDTIRAVVDAVTREASDFSASVADDLADPDLTPRKAKGRAAKCDAMVEKLAAYEGILGDALAGIRKRVETLRADAVAATLAAE